MAEHSKRASATKRGPGRYHQGGKPGKRLTKPRAVRAYVALMQAWASKRVTKAVLQDEHGAYTVTGPMFFAPELSSDSRYHDAFNGYVRRKWLAGISAQRGY